MRALNMVWVAIGGAGGAVLRYLVSGMAHSVFQRTALPVGTLTVNVLGCLIIGLLSGLAETHQLFTPQLRLLLLVGGLGSFTTFSTFGYEVFQLLRDGQFVPATTIVLLNVMIGLAAVWVGLVIARLI